MNAHLMAHCYKLEIAYEGTHYRGWQIQPNALTVQQLIQEALQKLLKGEKIVVIGSGRTDAGVHAMAQIAHFKWKEQLDPHKILFSLNGLLPRDIRVKAVEEVPLHFHAQHGAVSKTYHYYLFLEKVMDPFRTNHCWHVHKPLDKDLLRQGSRLFIGKHDFTSFANERAAGSVSKDPVRTIYRIDSVEIDGGLRLEFEGNGFLYKMVRNLVGALVDLASGKKSLDEIKKILAAKDRRQAPMAAPPQGLFLYHVNYYKVKP